MSSIGKGAPWRQRQRRDTYVLRAKNESWRSRAAYKLIEIDQTHRLTKSAKTALDLGAAPGSWSQYLSRKVNKVIACDLKEFPAIEGVTSIIGDFTLDSTQKEIKEQLLHAPLDILVSDCAPDISGNRDRDQAQMSHLIEETFHLANRLVKLGGLVLVKVLQGEQTQQLWHQYRRNQRLDQLKVVKPDASRPQSTETYWLAKLS